MRSKGGRRAAAARAEGEGGVSGKGRRAGRPGPGGGRGAPGWLIIITSNYSGLCGETLSNAGCSSAAVDDPARGREVGQVGGLSRVDRARGRSSRSPSTGSEATPPPRLAPTLWPAVRLSRVVVPVRRPGLESWGDEARRREEARGSVRGRTEGRGCGEGTGTSPATPPGVSFEAALPALSCRWRGRSLSRPDSLRSAPAVPRATRAGQDAESR